MWRSPPSHIVSTLVGNIDVPFLTACFPVAELWHQRWCGRGPTSSNLLLQELEREREGEKKIEREREWVVVEGEVNLTQTHTCNTHTHTHTRVSRYLAHKLTLTQIQKGTKNESERERERERLWVVRWRGEESKESRRVSYTRGLCKQNPTESRLALRLKHRARSQAATAKNETQRLGYRLFRIPRPFSLSLFLSLQLCSTLFPSFLLGYRPFYVKSIAFLCLAAAAVAPLGLLSNLRVPMQFYDYAELNEKKRVFSVSIVYTLTGKRETGQYNRMLCLAKPHQPLKKRDKSVSTRNIIILLGDPISNWSTERLYEITSDFIVTDDTRINFFFWRFIWKQTWGKTPIFFSFDVSRILLYSSFSNIARIRRLK